MAAAAGSPSSTPRVRAPQASSSKPEQASKDRIVAATARNALTASTPLLKEGSHLVSYGFNPSKKSSVIITPIVQGLLHVGAPCRNFVGREGLIGLAETYENWGLIAQNLLSQTHHFTRNCTYFVLCGERGLGKSATATHFAYIYANKFSFVWLIPCKTEKEYFSAYMELAAALKVEIEKGQSNASIIDMVHKKLEKTQWRKPWLLIFDDVNNMPLLPNRGGAILVTAKQRPETIPGDATYTLNVLAPEESLCVLQKVIGFAPTDPMKELALKLVGCPATLTLAGGLVGPAKELSLQQLNQLLGSADERNLLLSSLKTDEEVQKFIGIFNILAKALSFGLPFSEIKTYQSLVPILLKIGLLNTRLSRHTEAHQAYSENLKILRDISPDQPEIEVANALNNFGLSCRSLSRFTEAFEALKESLEIKQAIYGDQPRIATAMALHNVGLVLIDLKDFTKAFESISASLKMYIEIFKENPIPEIAKSVRNIARAFQVLEKPEKSIEAIEAHLQMLRTIHRDQSHNDIAHALKDIALMYKDLGQYTQALEAFQQCLKVYGDQLPKSDVAFIYFQVGSLQSILEKHSESLEAYKESLKIARRIYGEKPDPRTANTLNYMGLKYIDLGQQREGLHALYESLSLKRSLVGDQHHISVISTINNIAGAHLELEEYEQAIKAYGESSAMCRSLYGDVPHPYAVIAYDNTGLAYIHLGDFPKALEFYQKGTEMLDKLNEGRPSFDMAIALHNMGHVYNKCGKPEKALDTYKRSLQMKRALFTGPNHLPIAKTLLNIGSLLQTQGKFDEALTAYQENLEILRAVHGDAEDPEIAKSFYNMGIVYERMGNACALEYFQRSLDMQRSLYRDDTHTEIVLTLAAINRLKEAEN
jgi:tetratricopeptide (TPR) repeat protein